MGSKTWIQISYNNSVAETLSKAPSLDRAKTDLYVESLFPKHTLTEVGEVNLTVAAAEGRHVYAACYDDIYLLSCKELAKDRPSQIPVNFRSFDYGKNQCLICLYSVVDWFAMSIWESGELVRAVSVSPDSEVMEDIGTKLSFEEPYWNGQHSPLDPDDEEDTYSLSFHPLELGEQALLHRFGYQIEGYPENWKFDPEKITLVKYVRSKPHWWKFW